MGNTNPTRRTALKACAGFVAGSAVLASATSASSETEGIDTDFDPNRFGEVDRFVHELFDAEEDPLESLEEWNETGEMDPVFSRLREEQVEAFLDAILPRYVMRERAQISHPGGRSREDPSVSPGEILSEEPGTALQSYDARVQAIAADPAEKWGWDKNEVHDAPPGRDGDVSPPGRGGDFAPPGQDGDFVPPGRDNRSNRSGQHTGSRPATASSPQYEYNKSYSDTVHAYAASIDYTGYKWRGRIYWSHYRYSNIVDDIDAADTVLHTNYAVTHEGTDIDVVDRETEFDAYFQAHFDNDLGEICINYRFGEYCVDLQQSFHPYMELQGRGTGGGSTLASGNDSLLR